jgi:hypothetical protein
MLMPILEMRTNIIGASAYRNIFIVFIITVGLFAIYFTLLQTFKTENEGKKAEEFDLRSLNSGWNRVETIRALEMDLARCQRTLNFMRLLGKESEQSTNPPTNSRRQRSPGW